MADVDFHVFNTYVKSKNGQTVHFDIITDKKVEKAISFTKEWLSSINEESATVTTQ